MSNNFEINDLIDALLEKSKEAYLMSIEIINKPTINYRTEGFCFFICNAWELMLKAYLIRKQNSIDAIMFKDDSNRTISLSTCIDKIFTSTTDKVKSNLNFIVAIRNKSTHLIISEFDYTLTPFFQQNLYNFNNFYSKHFNEHKLNSSVQAYVSINSFNLPKPNALLLFDEIENLKNYIESSSRDEGMTQKVDLHITKNKNEATMTVAIDNNSTESVKVLKIPKDINLHFPFSFKEIHSLVVDTIKINLDYNITFTTKNLMDIIRDFKVKENSVFSYVVNVGNQKSTKYSKEFFEFIVSKFTTDKDFMTKYKKKDS